MTLGESSLIFHWCLYNKVQYSCTCVKGFHETDFLSRRLHFGGVVEILKQ